MTADMKKGLGLLVVSALVSLFGFVIKGGADAESGLATFGQIVLMGGFLFAVAGLLVLAKELLTAKD